jgi:hypothetical protein
MRKWLVTCKQLCRAVHSVLVALNHKMVALNHKIIVPYRILVLCYDNVCDRNA